MSSNDSVIKIGAGEAALSQELLDSCIHCGLCLPACPTYLATGREMESPRGRIYLLAKWQELGGELAPRAAEHLESCLGCLGCQTACPSGVNYEAILDGARPHLAARRNGLLRTILRFSFSQILPHYGRLKIFGSMLRTVQQLKLDSLAAKFSTSKLAILRKLADFQMFTPVVPKHIPLPKKSWRAGTKSGAAKLFSGCVMDVFYNHVNHAALRLLVRQGNIVEVPEQTCCGALAYHAGEDDIARVLARRNIDLFEGAVDNDKIVVTSAGCGAMLKHYPVLLANEPQWADRASKFASRVQDLSQTLAAGDFPADTMSCPSAAGPETQTKAHIVYHAACHLAHAQGVRAEPQALLSALAAGIGAHLYDLPEAEHCCGSAGIYNLLNTSLSLKVLDRKMKFIEESGADLVVTCNPGCMLQLEAGVKARGLNVKVKHLAEALDDACQ